MRSTADCIFLFPGQGAQTLGMAVDLCERFDEARAVFDRARQVLGYDILATCREGPKELLDSTRVSQPAIFLHSMAVLEVLRRGADSGSTGAGTEGIDPARGLEGRGAAGLSLGEYSALVFARALSFEDALAVVARRGEFMQEACDDRAGTMASVLGLDAARIDEVVSSLQAEGGEVWVANYNSPSQTVISGAVEAVEACVDRLKAAGARRAILLRVAGAYHSKLMASATEKLRPLISKLEVRAPRCAFYQNAGGRRVSAPEEIREGLLRQVESPVRWVECVEAIARDGGKRGLEVGPGRVLKGLVEGTIEGFDVTSVGTVESLESLQTEERSR